MSPVTPVPRSSPAARTRGTTGAWALALRFAGALAIVAVGSVHLWEYVELYSAIPTIGTLFMLNFAGAVGLALVLVCPVERLAGRRGELLVVIAALAGMAQAALGLVLLAISQHGSLFGFHEPGYDPAAIAASRAAEAAAVLLLGAHLCARIAVKTPMRRW